MRTRVEAVCAFVAMVFIGTLLVSFTRSVEVDAQQTSVSSADGYAFQTVTVSLTAVGLTATTINPTNAPGARVMFCSVENQPIRYRFDGTVPTAIVGHPSGAGEVITLVGPNSITNFRAIRSGISDATLSCTLSR